MGPDRAMGSKALSLTILIRLAMSESRGECPLVQVFEMILWGA